MEVMNVYWKIYCWKWDYNFCVKENNIKYYHIFLIESSDIN